MGMSSAAKQSCTIQRHELPRQVLDNLIEGCQVIDHEFRYAYVNDALVAQARLSREELLGRTMMECYRGIESTPMFATLTQCMEDRSSATIENFFEFPDGKNAWFELRLEPVPNGVAILSVDITERKALEESLRSHVRSLDLLQRCKTCLIQSNDEATLLKSFCAAIAETLGYSQVTVDYTDPAEGSVPHAGGRNVASHRASFDSPCQFPIVKGAGKVLGTLNIVAGDRTLSQADCALLQEVCQEFAYGIESLRERADHAKTQEQLYAAQRLEAVGRLAGGVAHDFNNLLSVILTYSRFISDEAGVSPQVRSDVEQIHQAGLRAATLTRQLLAFSRKQLLEPKVSDLNQMVRGVESMLRRLLGEDIDIRVHLDPHLGNTFVDPGQFDQVLMNLAVNARDAMPRGGILTIETSNVELDETYAREHVAVSPGSYVQLSVADNGTGMSAEIRERIFEPFFTTKDVDKGTGLGLATAYGIVKQSGGNIWVYSEEGRGTIFKVYLPRTEAATIDLPDEPMPPSLQGRETLLLVEDEPSVREAAARVLTNAGYKVLSAASGEEALELHSKHRGAIDLLISDLIMPHMDGRELAELVRKRAPSIKVLFMSGYTGAAAMGHGFIETGVHFMNKPFSVRDLASHVRTALEKEPRARDR